MSLRRFVHLVALITTGLMTLPFLKVGAQQPRSVPIDFGKRDIAGVVASSKGPEAGVWVIAETMELPTKFVRIVVTDDQGRYLIPDLPQANYQIFVRGYGLLDSERQPAKPGQRLDLKAEVAPDARRAAQVYPAAWWLSMLTLPEDKEFHKKFTMDLKECFDCHQVGNKTTRELATSASAGATSTLDAWDRRTRVGPSGPAMSNFFQAIGPQRNILAEWTDRIIKGEAPAQTPPRPRGVERNLVITEWEWGTPKDGRSDNAASDTRNARVNANGLVFGASEMTDTISILDPVQNKATVLKAPSEAPPLVSAFNASPTPSPHFGSDVWKRSADPRSVAIDGKGRAWVAIRNRESQQQPAFCGPGPNKFGNFYPLKQSNPPATCHTEFYEPPLNQEIEVYGSGGVDADSHGVIWQNWRASGHFSAFDRTVCKSTKDPRATGQSCPEGWTLYRMNDPTYTNSVFHANESYLTHMDLHDALGLGKDAPMYGSVNTDAIEVLNLQTRQFVTLRVPYPMGFFPRSANGRIDDPKAGWKGKGLWADFASYAGWHIEGGPGTLPKAVKFQLRPNPLAR